jgi:hypothetical protein
MATRAFIAIQNPESESFDGVYCHFDGYRDGVGKTLEENYNTPEKVRELIEGGDMSSLAPTLEQTEFYTKRGEGLKIARNIHSLFYLKGYAKKCGCEFLYFFDNDGWKSYKF